MTKKTLVFAWLVIFAFWPLLQRALVAAFDLNAWRFSGWAMYATPVFPARMYLFQVAPTDDGLKQPTEVPPEQWSPALQAEAQRYAVRRTNLGSLAGPPQRLGELLLGEHGHMGAVAVVVQNRSLNRETKILETSLEKYGYATGIARLD